MDKDNSEIFKAILEDQDTDNLTVGHQNEFEPPKRDLEMISTHLKTVHVGDILQLEIGSQESAGIVEGEVIAKRGQQGKTLTGYNWEYTVDIRTTATVDRNSLLFRTGINGNNDHPWFVLSYVYNNDLGAEDQQSEIGRGWVKSIDAF